MQETASSFTGRARQRKTSRKVLLQDRAARLLISVGGIGTIFAVLGVCVFLVWVVAPLFLPAKIDNLDAFDSSGEKMLHLAIDEYGLLSWILRPSGRIDVIRLDNGGLRETVELLPDGLLTSFSHLIRGDLVILGRTDGKIQRANVGFSPEVLDAADLPAAIVDALGAAAVSVADYESGVVEPTPNGQFRTQRVRVELGKEFKIAAGPVLLVSHVIGPNGPLIAAVAADVDRSSAPVSTAPEVGPADATGPADQLPENGNSLEAVPAGMARLRLVVIAGNERSNFLTGEKTLEFDDPVEIPVELSLEDPPSHLALAGAGDTLYLAWSDGRIRRFETPDLENSYLAESGSLVESGRSLETLGFVLGSNTLLWGDDEGMVRAGFLVPNAEFEGQTLVAGYLDPRADKTLAWAKELTGDLGSPAVAMASSARSRMVFVGWADGRIKLFNITSASELATYQLPLDAGEPLTRLVMAPKEDKVVAATSKRIFTADLDPRYPEASFNALFRPVWYEGYDRPHHTWQSSSGTDDFEAKLGLVPLIFGTFKATLYSMMFGVPLALLAALFTSEFLHPRAKTVIKPGIELMASLPSVVLGFLAALVFAPLVEKIVPATLASFFTIPLVFLGGAYLWQLLPVDLAIRWGNWRILAMALVAPFGLLLAFFVGPWFESWLFSGDIKGWLAWDPGAENAEAFADPIGGWVLLFLPVSAFVVAFAIGRFVDPQLRNHSSRWDRQTFARADMMKLVLGVLTTFGLALGLAYLVSSLGFDPRGGLIDTYGQRNAMIVGFVMGFAIVPIIYTISEDALATVPEHLRSASLGAGATQWQTATRIIIPTAMSGLFSAMMVGLGRAVGETMIVLMAAGNTPVLEWNIFQGFRTLSANIAVELPEAVRGSTHYRTLFLAALVLFILTFIVNTVAEVIRQRFRKRAYQL